MRQWYPHFHDLLRLTLFGVILATGLWGVVLPYRHVFAQAGDYQLEAFESGLAFFHYGFSGQPQFYQLSPVNDFISGADGVRQAHLPAVTPQQESLSQVLLAMPSRFFATQMPNYEVKISSGALVSYRSVRVGQEWVITKTITFAEPTFVAETGISLGYDRATVLLSTDGRQAQITDPKRPGSLVVLAEANQQLSLNQEYHFIALVQPVGQTVTTLQQTMRLRSEETP